MFCVTVRNGTVVTALAWQHKGLKFKYYQGKIFLQPFFSQAGVKKKAASSS